MFPFILAFSKLPQVISYKGALKSKKAAKPAIKKCWLVTAIITKIKQGKIDETETTLSVSATPKGKYHFILLVTSLNTVTILLYGAKIFRSTLFYVKKAILVYINSGLTNNSSRTLSHECYPGASWDKLLYIITSYQSVDANSIIFLATWYIWLKKYYLIIFAE